MVPSSISVIRSSAIFSPSLPGEERRLPVNGAAVDGLEDVAEQAAGGARLEDHRDALGFHLHRAQPAQRACRGLAPHGFRVFQTLVIPRDSEPVVALHAAVLRGDGHGRNRAIAGSIRAEKPARVGEHAAADARIERSAFGVGDARIDRERGGFGALGDLDALLGGQVRPSRSEKSCRSACERAQFFGIGQARMRIFRGQRRRDRWPNAPSAECLRASGPTCRTRPCACRSARAIPRRASRLPSAFPVRPCARWRKTRRLRRWCTRHRSRRLRVPV